MNKTELIQRVASVMRENNIRKPVSSQKKVFHISDDDGNVSDFVIKKSNKGTSRNSFSAVICGCARKCSSFHLERAALTQMH